MIRLLVWKELREQAMAAVALLIIGGGVLWGVQIWNLPADHADGQTGWILLCVFAWACGLVVGVQPFAGEVENGTDSFLDALPARRRVIWVGKSLACLMLLAMLIAVLTGLARVLKLTPGLSVPDHPLVVIGYGVMALACGLFGSAVARSQIGAIGAGLLGQLLAAVGLGFAAAILTRLTSRSAVVECMVLIVAVIGPAFVSFRIYTRPDRRRLLVAVPGAQAVKPSRVLFWLVWRQVRWFHAVILIAGLLTASILPRTAPAVWPFFGLVFGAMLGVSAFAPDNLGGSVRFLGERRLPLGRLWLIKTAIALAPISLIILAFLLNVWLAFTARAVVSGSTSEPARAEIWLSLGFDGAITPSVILLGPIYGFAVGQFFGLACRKGAVAAVLTLVTAGVLLAIWVPSMIAGGLLLWQWLIAPLVVIAATRLAMRPWVAGRLSDWRPALGMAGAGLLALAGIAFGLWWRAVEFPAVGQPFDPVAFLRSPPTPEQRETDQKMQLAAHQFDAFYETELAPDSGRAANRRSIADMRYSNPAYAALTNGWPAADPNLNDWMDRAFSGEWLQTLREAAAMRPGLVRFPESGGSDTPDSTFWQIRRLLCVRGLQLQARGDQSEAFAMFRLAFDVERRLRFRTLPWNYLSAVATERVMLQALCVWAGNAADKPELLREAIGMLRENELALPPFIETVEAGYSDATSRMQRFHPAQLAPWEWERWSRIIGWLFAGWKRTAKLDYHTAIELAEPAGTPTPPYTRFQSWLPPVPQENTQREREKLRSAVGDLGERWPYWISDEMFSQEPWTLACWRGARLQIALLLFEKEHGKPAERLDDLVPAILDAVPADPFGNGPFHYRVSQGEQIIMSSYARDNSAFIPITVEPGQGIIWSVSTDTVDDGGVRNGGYFSGFGRGKPGYDLIFIVPRAQKK